MSNKLFVGNLAYETTENDLADLFAGAGAVTNTDIIQDKFTGKSRGFAFVEMASGDEATKAIELFNGKDLNGRALTVNVARPKEDRPRSGSFGGGGGRRDGDRRQRY